MFDSYAYDLIKVISNDVFEGMACLFLLVFVVFIVCKGFRTGLRYSSGLLLIGYLFLLFCLTIFFRPISDTSQYDFHPFWSYKAILDGRYGLLSENIMNVVVFIPVGFLLGIAFKQMTWCKALLMGCGISVTIEALQLFLHRGFTETDDVMHNTFGCLIGYGIMTILRILFNTRYNNV
jgi:glycopeptide antibiotics resistance protein